MGADEANRGFELEAGVLGPAERRVIFSRLYHFRTGVREVTETVKIEAPNMKAGGA